MGLEVVASKGGAVAFVDVASNASSVGAPVGDEVDGAASAALVVLTITGAVEISVATVVGPPVLELSPNPLPDPLPDAIPGSSYSSSPSSR